MIIVGWESDKSGDKFKFEQQVHFRLVASLDKFDEKILDL